MRFDNEEQKFRGVFRNASAKMKWSARVGNFEFQSARLPQLDDRCRRAGVGKERHLLHPAR